MSEDRILKAIINDNKYSIFLNDDELYGIKEDEKNTGIDFLSKQKNITCLKCLRTNSRRYNFAYSYLFDVAFKENSMKNEIIGKYYAHAIMNENNESFNGIRFRAKILNYFYHPEESICGNNSLNEDGSKIIEIKKFDDKTISGTGKLLNENVDMIFSIVTPGGYDISTESLGNVYTIFQINFKNKIKVTDTLKFVEIVKKVFSFTFHIRNIFFEKITLLDYNNEKYYPIGSLVINENYNAMLKFNYFKFPNLLNFKNNFFNLFEFFSDDDNNNLLILPMDINDEFEITPQKYVVLAGTFENIVDKYYKNEFKNSFELTTVLSFINEFIDKKDEEFFKKNKKIRDELKYIKKNLENLTTSAKEKFLFIFNKYNSNLIPFIENLEKRYEIQLSIKEEISINNDNVQVVDINDIARDFCNQRNCFAHGSYKICDTNSIIGYEITRILIYIIILKKCNFNDEEIEKIINPLFYYLKA